METRLPNKLEHREHWTRDGSHGNMTGSNTDNIYVVTDEEQKHIPQS